MPVDDAIIERLARVPSSPAKKSSAARSQEEGNSKLVLVTEVTIKTTKVDPNEVQDPD